MKLAVLPVWCSDSTRITTLTRDWIHRAVGHVAGYYQAQSGGREIPEFRVFDWFRLDLSSAQWNAGGFAIGAAVARRQDHLDLFQVGFDGRLWSTFWR